jgi:hypothetical protein
MTVFGEEMRRLMTERGLSLRRVAKLTSYDVGYLSKVMNGRKPATRKVAGRLDHTLGANGVLLAAASRPQEDRGDAHPGTGLVAWLGLPGPPGLAQKAARIPPDPVARAVAGAMAAGPEDPGGYRGEQYRQYSAGNRLAEAGVLRDEVISALAAESQDFGEWIGMSEVADATIEQYTDQVKRLARDFEYAPVLPLMLEARQLRARVAFQLRRHQRLSQARELYLLGAQVCGLLAWMTGDLGNYRAADTHAWTAWMCAEQAGHDGARAWVRATQAKLAYWDRRYDESAELAGDGLDHRCADSAHVFLALFRARALARSGHRRETMHALGQAAAKRDGVRSPDLLGGVWELTPARYHGLAAGIQLLLDEPGQAVTEAAQAITLSEAVPAAERHLYAEMLVRTDQAQAHLRQPDLDGAAAALCPVFELDAGMRTEPIVQQLRQLGQFLALPRFASTPQAQGLRERIDACGRDATLPQLPA